MKYHVFTRLAAGDDLLHVGTVQADTDRLAKLYAYETYDEEDWNLMVVVADDDLLEVEGKSLATDGGSATTDDGPATSEGGSGTIDGGVADE